MVHTVECRTGLAPYLSSPASMDTRYSRRRCFRRGVATGISCVERDGERQLTMVGKANVITTYRTRDLVQIKRSGAYASITDWVRLRYDARTSTLWCLGRQGASAPTLWRLFVSRDQGMTGTEVFSVAARSAVVERDSERAVLVTLWENSGNVQRQVSLDGGETWSAAEEATLAGAAFAAELYDITQDSRQSVMLLAANVSGAGKVLLSRDMGATWTLALTI